MSNDVPSIAKAILNLSLVEVSELGFVKKDELLTKDMLIKLSKSKKKSQPLKILSSACDFPYNSFRCEYDKISLSALKKLGLKAS